MLKMSVLKKVGNISATNIYTKFKSYIEYPSFNQMIRGDTKYSEEQFARVGLMLKYSESKKVALEDCEETIKYLHEQGFTDLSYSLFEGGLIAEATDERKGLATALLRLDNYADNVKALHQMTPFFYDKAKLFWFWNKDLMCWEMVDETDVLVKIDHELNFGGQLITAGIKSNYLEAFKQVGRVNIPRTPKKEWVQFGDKVYNYTTKETAEVSPKYFFCNPIPWKLGKSKMCPTIEKLFKDWVGEENVETLFEILAYCCVADYPIHLIFCLVGSGRNGKSQFQKIVQKFIGSNNISSTELDQLIDNRFESAKLYKKLVCTLGETNFGMMAKTSLLKKLSGGDLIGYEFKQKNPFDDYNYAKIVINSNSLPSSLDTSDGFYRRWMIIDFPNEFKEGKDIVTTIPEEEYHNLARRCCFTLAKLLKNGKFTNQGSIEERRKKYIMASNPLPFFLEKFCYVNGAEYVQNNKLYNAFVKYLLKNRKRVVSRKEFTSILNEEGFFSMRTTKDSESTYWVDGLSLKHGWEELIKNTGFSPNCEIDERGIIHEKIN